MRKTSLSKLLFALMLVLMLALVACSKDSAGDKKPADKPKETEKEKEKDDEEEKKDDGLFHPEDFSMDTANTGEAIAGGELTYGLVSASAFEGTLHFNFYAGAPDAEVIKWFDESLLDTDENYNYTNDGAATYEVDEDGKVFTFTIRDEVNWQDGEPVKAEDWAYSFEVIGHADYDGVRYGSDFTNIEGMVDYHAGKSDTISGIEIVSDKVLKITFLESNPSLLNGGIWPYAMPKHIFKDIPVAEMAASDAIRKNPIGMGPYKVESIVPGESVVYSKFEGYWRGEPALDKVTLKVVSPEVVAKSLEKGEIDMVGSFPGDQFEDNADMSNVEFLGAIDLYYAYVGFKLGTWDAENEQVKMDPDKKMANVDLRKAMAHAVDTNAVGEKFYKGLRWKATSLIPPSLPLYHDETNPGIEYDPEKAKQLLADAGYVDVDGDGLVEDPDGNKLVINFASMEGSDVAEPMAQYYIQSWKNIGLDVQLLDGRLQEFNAFYDRVGRTGEDDPEIDVYAGAWGTGSDVDPSGLYGRDAMFNFPRWAHDDNDRLLAEGLSEESFDLDHRREVYKEWNQLMIDEVPVFPTLFAMELTPVNKRVTNYSVDPGTELRLYQVGVTEAEPFKAE